MSTLTAGPLDQKHKYHMFFAYHPSNKEWLQELVQRLESEPWAYKCCYADRDFDSRCTSTQNVLCSIMLSHRIVVVLTPRFIKDQWDEYEESLAHLASMTLRKQRVIPIILEETNIPDSLRMLRAVDARREDFWDVFLQNVCLGKYSLNQCFVTYVTSTLHILNLVKHILSTEAVYFFLKPNVERVCISVCRGHVFRQDMNNGPQK